MPHAAGGLGAVLPGWRSQKPSQGRGLTHEPGHRHRPAPDNATAPSTPRQPLPRPTRGLARGLAAVTLLLLCTGGTWLALHYTLGAGADQLPHPAEPWLMRLHGAGAFLALFGAGLLTGSHVGGAQRHRAYRHAMLGAAPPGHPIRGAQEVQARLGWVSGAAFIATAASGYALFYFAPDWLRPGLGWAHAGAGLLMLSLGWWHGRHSRVRGRTVPGQKP